jgi:very-short-patch-repair endonuclease
MLLVMYRDQQQRDFARDLRNHCSPAEARLWQHLRASKLGVKFRRQAAIGSYIVDFVCFTHRLVVELDGPQHVDQQGYDARRTDWLISRGFRVIRFRNQVLDDEIDRVVEEIKRESKACEAAITPPHPSPSQGRE